MRDRGITRPDYKAALWAALGIAGAAAFIWGSGQPPVPPGEASAGGFARSLGILALIVGSLASLNFLYACWLVGKMRRGEGVIASWTVSPAAFDRFRQAEKSRKRRRNVWRMPWTDRPAGLPVIFTADSVLVGHSYFRLLTRGMSRFSFVRIESDGVRSVEFSMRMTVIGAGTLSQTARYRGHLRIPIADGAESEAARVVAHFKAALND